jgi:diguanylate cyclase (GGDEF)-like protein
MIDLDHFKLVNDNYGHAAGDSVLKDSALLIQSQVRDADAVCRWGGEEFVVVMKDCPAKAAHAKAEQLRLHVERQVFNYQANEIALTMSLGVAELQKGEGLTDLLDRADSMLYQAKSKGRNRTYPAEQT